MPRTPLVCFLLALACLAPLAACASAADESATTSDEELRKKKKADAGADASADAGADATTDAGPDGSVGQRFRVIAGNLSTGNKQSWDPGEGARIASGLHPDVAMLQELNVGANADADVRTWVTATFGASYNYTRGTGQIPNAIISRFPIVRAGTFVDPLVNNRDHVWAELAMPDGHRAFVVSVHLLTNGHGPVVHAAEASALVASLTQLGVQPADYVMVGGDFNTHTPADNAVTGLGALLHVTGPFPTGPSTKSAADVATNSTRSSQEDYVLTSESLERLSIPVSMPSGLAFPTGLVLDTRSYAPLTDIPGTLATDSAANGMQHMAVVRDFAL
jgi:endonuclease/exonuclease/phosphatase family metal-dependent hydrolase